jgi:hypothetical protein
LNITHSVQGTQVSKTAQHRTQIASIEISASPKTIVDVSPILGVIGACESGNNPLAKNRYSSASGRFQFIKSSWEYYGKELWGADWVNHNIFSWNDNTELANFVYLRNGTSDWLESKPCWSRYS